MKTSLIAGLFLLGTLAGNGQPSGSIPQGAPAGTAYAVVERGADYRVWEKTSYERAPGGAVVPRKHRYTELSGNMHYQDGSGQWLESSELIEALPQGGAAALHGRYPVYFPDNIYEGAIQVLGPDGQSLLKSRPVAICFDDGTNTVLLGELKSSTGYLVGSNRVVYPDAFATGAVRADLICTYRRSKFEADLVFRQQPPAPERYGMRSDCTRLQLVTECFDTPEPEKRPGPARAKDGLTDTTLKFGDAVMGPGKAFSVGSAHKGTNGPPSAEIPVYKSWLHLENRTFLIEQTLYEQIAPTLKALPSTTGASLQRPSQSLFCRLSAQGLLPASRPVQASTKAMLLAQAENLKQAGVALDYYIIFDGSYSVLPSATYLVTGNFYMSSVTFADNVVIKYDPDSPGTIFASDVCSFYGSVFFTSKDDNSLGEEIDGSTGYPLPVPTIALGLSTSNVVMNVLNGSAAQASFRWLERGVMVWTDSDVNLTGFSFSQCNIGIEHGGGGSLNLSDPNFDACQVCVYQDAGSVVTVNTSYVIGQNSPYHNCTYVTAGDVSSGVNTFTTAVKPFTASGGTGSLYADVCLTYASSAPSGVQLSWQAADGSGSAYWGSNSCFSGTSMGVVPSGCPALLLVPNPSVPVSGSVTNFTLQYAGGGLAWNGRLGNEATDSDADGLPDWWELQYFGHALGSAMDRTAAGDDYDGDGQSNLAEYLAGTDPNTISFHPHFESLYISSSVAVGSLSVNQGVPVQMAVLINQTNFSSAGWQAFSSTLNVPLSSTDAVYTVWIGLKGRAATSEETWESVHLTRDTLCPVLFLTEPLLTSGATLVTSQRVIQLRGYSPEPLSRIEFDLSNGDGTLSNQWGGITQQSVDPVTLQDSTCWFECPDLVLSTNGPNQVTLRVTDRAGNQSSTNLSITLDLGSDGTPPSVSLVWPQDGDTLCGSSLTLRGNIDDPNATVSAQIVDGEGNTNVMNGVVEVSGLLWVEGLPLGTGTNTVTLTMTNAAGNSSTTNLSVVRGSVHFTMDTIPESQLIQPVISLTGTIDSPDYTVWINGVEVTNYTANGQGGWNWQVDNVPTGQGGTAVFDTDLIPNSGQQGNRSSGGGRSAPSNPASADRQRDSASVEKPAYYFVQTYSMDSVRNQDWSGLWWEVNPEGADLWWDSVRWTNRLALTNATTSGMRNHGYFFHVIDAQGLAHDSSQTNAVVYPPDGWPAPQELTLQGQVTITSLADPTPILGTEDPPQIAWEKWQEDLFYSALDYEGTGRFQRVAQARITLRTGGKRLSSRKNIFHLTTSAMAYPTHDPSYQWLPEPVAPAGIKVLGKPLTPLPDNSGELYVALPDNTEWDITPATTAERYTFALTPTKHRLVSNCYSDIPTNKNRTTLGVGEWVYIGFSPALPTNAAWSTTAGSVTPTNFWRTTLEAPSNATDVVTVKGNVNGAEASMDFNVVEPSGVKATLRGAPDYYPDLPAIGAGMHLNVFLQPTNVSFYRLEMMEPGAQATSTSGYFLGNAPAHDQAHGANKWHPVYYDNLVTDGDFDHASSYGWPIGQWGSYTWPISPIWRVKNSNATNSLRGWTEQVHTLTNDGTVMVQKLGHHVTRQANEHYGTAE